VYAAGATLVPSELNCGCQNSFVLTSFQITMSLTVGKRLITLRTYEQ